MIEELTNRLRAAEILADPTLALVAVELVETRRRKTASGYRLFVNIAPVAVVVQTAEETYALDMDARGTDLDRLLVGVPELQTMLAELQNRQNSPR